MQIHSYVKLCKFDFIFQNVCKFFFVTLATKTLLQILFKIVLFYYFWYYL